MHREYMRLYGASTDDAAWFVSIMAQSIVWGDGNNGISTQWTVE